MLQERKIVISACLVGINCRYDGRTILNHKASELVEKGNTIPVCPEELGGLLTPRTEAERRGERVITKNGEDVTEQFALGAKLALEIAQSARAETAILKARSPSCGSGQIYDGTFTRTLTEGDGVFAELCKKEGIKVLTEEDL